MPREILEKWLMEKHHFADRTVKMLNDGNLAKLAADYCFRESTIRAVK